MMCLVEEPIKYNLNIIFLYTGLILTTWVLLNDTLKRYSYMSSYSFYFLFCLNSKAPKDILLLSGQPISLWNKKAKEELKLQVCE